MTLARQQRDDADWPDTETAESIFALYRDLAYQDSRAMILRDAGVISAVFTLLIALLPLFGPNISSSTSQRVRFLLLAILLYITPGLVGQVVFQKLVPIEILLLKSWGEVNGLIYVGYCSGRSLLSGLVDEEAYTVLAIFHDLKVVVLAGLLVFLILGLIPSGKQKC